MAQHRKFLDLALEIRNSDLPSRSTPIGDIKESDSVETIPIAKGEFTALSGKAAFGVTRASGLEITTLNQFNRGTDSQPDDSDEGKLVRFPEHPWSYDENKSTNVALVYRLGGKVDGNLGVAIPVSAGASVSLGLQAETRYFTDYVHIRRPEDSQKDAVRDDIEHRFRVAFSPAAVLSLDPMREYLVSEFEAGFAFKVGISWGEVFRADVGLLRALSPGGEALLISASAGIEAFANFNVGFSSRLQLIASKRNSSTVRLEFRKAKRNARSLTAGLQVVAGIDNPGDVEAGLDALLARALNYRSVDLSDLRRKLDSIQKTIDLEKLLDSELKQLSASLTDRLGFSLSGLVSFIEDSSWFRDTLSELFDQRDISTTVLEKLEEEFSALHSHVSLAALGSDAASAAEKILVRLDLLPGDLALLPGLLEDPHFETLFTNAFASIDAGTLDELNRQITDLVDGIEPGNLSSDKVRSLVRLIEEETTVTLPELYERFVQAELSERLAGGRERLRGFRLGLSRLPAIADEFVGEEKLLELAETLSARFEVGILQLGEKLESLKDRVIRAAKSKIELSAKLEFGSVRTSEALFGFDFLQVQQNRELFVQIYENLLDGNLQFAVDSYHANPPLFANTDFFEADTIEKKRSFQIRGFMRSGKEIERRRSSVRDIEEQKMLSMRESLALSGGAGKRDWLTYFILTAKMPRFTKTPKTSDFEYRMEFGVSHTGMVKPPNLPRKRENREIIQLMGATLTRCEKADVADDYLNDALNLAFENSEFPLLRIDLILEHEALLWLWNSDENLALLKRNLDSSWKTAKNGTKIDGNKKPGSDVSEALSLFGQFGAIANGKETPYALSEHAIAWSKGYRNAVKQNRDFPFKYCFQQALALTLPSDLPGWSISGLLETREGQLVFG